MFSPAHRGHLVPPTSVRLHLAAVFMLVLAALSSFPAFTYAQTENQTQPTLADPAVSAMMTSTDNPLVLIQSSQGDIYLELFPEAAPRNVERFLALAEAALPVPAADGASPAPLHYYDGLTFHRVIRDTLIQSGAAERADRLPPATAVIDEINARGLGLEQQQLLDASGQPHPWMNIADRADFQRKVLVPLYRDMGIYNEAQLRDQQQAVMRRLESMNLLQLHELMGYRYDGTLPSRRPVRGSVMMVNNGPGSNDGEFFITLVDTPWLTGTSTVIGRVVSGMELAERISNSPDATTRIYQIRQINTTAAAGAQSNGQDIP